MQFIKSVPGLLFFIAPLLAGAQSAYFQQGSKEYILMERLEIKAQRDSILNFSYIKPFNRKWWVQSLDRLEKKPDELDLSEVDRYNIGRSRMNNLEWVTGDKSAYQSKRPILKTFYKTPANLIEVDNPDFFLSINPVLQLNYIHDDQNDEMTFLNSRGFVARGLIAKKLGFQSFLTENQERAPQFVEEQIRQFRAVPGAGVYKPFKGTAHDYYDLRGSVFFNAAKFLDLQFGYDKQFIGNGYRSLFLSDISSSYLFFNLNLRVWKLNYVSKVVELTSQHDRAVIGDVLNPKKYMAVHHISFNAPKWLTLGLFEAVVFGRPNQFEFSYLNPIIFLRPMEAQLGSPDNAFVGLDFKANAARKLQFYGQLLLDEFYLKDIRQGGGPWTSKWGLQLGAKYIDVLGVKNLDLQVEANLVRPFTYSHRDTVANYTHYNQPLAHPLMSNFKEYVGILRYQPAPKWYLQGRINLWTGGKDVNGANWGNNIFRDYNTRAANYGVYFGSAQPTKYMNANLWVAHEFRENLFLEANMSLRRSPEVSSNFFGSVGLRLNMHRREYDY